MGIKREEVVEEVVEAEGTQTKMTKVVRKLETLRGRRMYSLSKRDISFDVSLATCV